MDYWRNSLCKENKIVNFLNEAEQGTKFPEITKTPVQLLQMIIIRNL